MQRVQARGALEAYIYAARSALREAEEDGGAAALQPLASKPLVVWAWMARFWAEALSGELEAKHRARLEEVQVEWLERAEAAKEAEDGSRPDEGVCYH